MPVGQGKYGREANTLAKLLDAELIILGVVGGTRGQGFSITCTSHELMRQVPDLLEGMAQGIRESLDEDTLAAKTGT